MTYVISFIPEMISKMFNQSYAQRTLLRIDLHYL
jgi:hypothetical protein